MVWQDRHISRRHKAFEGRYIISSSPLLHCNRMAAPDPNNNKNNHPTDAGPLEVTLQTTEPPAAKRPRIDGQEVDGIELNEERDPLLDPAVAPVAAAAAPPPPPQEEEEPDETQFVPDPTWTNQNKKDGIPPWRKIQQVLLSEESAAKHLMDKGIIQVPTLCPKCHQTLRYPTKGVRIRCKKCYSRNGSEWSQSMLKGTFFEFGRLKVHDMLMFLYHWLCGAKVKQLCLLMGWSNSTMFRWISYVQELVAAVTFYEPNINTNNNTDKQSTDATFTGPIGGRDVVVQIEDCSFDKRHCQHPDFVPGGWIFCGVEVTPKKRFFSCVVTDVSPEGWMGLVRKHIAEGSLVKTNHWKSNRVLDLQPGNLYRHQPKQQLQGLETNNPFVNPFQGQPPPDTEETWIVLEPMPAQVPRKHNNVKEVPGSLFEFIWRKKHESNLWNALLWTIKQVKYEISYNNQNSASKAN